ncbi:uncharacterized protein LOC128999782 [Macrosteles quadrilineatus]|uniref:uncharacterized protein LOC128999782 n=1 Tax=Macrosteles quadrilineatus TaxID=74068 RepID=UPI0023E266F9|nr:uncharacterized protein LOC128999782 [Macrosteles quadrilineatus]
MKEAMNRKKGIQWGINSRLEDLDFADDLCIMAQSFRDIEAKLNDLRVEAQQVGLKINARKTKEMRLNNRNNTPLRTGGDDIERANEFCYLGSMVTEGGGADRDMENRLNKARAAFAQLRVWWPEFISNEDLWARTDQEHIAIQINRRKWRWIGHILRQPQDTVARQALEWNPQGNRRRGRPRTTWRRTVEKELNSQGMTWARAKELANQRDRWRVRHFPNCVQTEYGGTGTCHLSGIKLPSSVV